MTTDMPEHLYRFEDVPTVNGVRVERRKFKVIKETPCGYWIRLYESFDDKKWVSKTARNRFAYPVLDDAITNFKARKRRQIEILEARLRDARSALNWVDPTFEYAPRPPRIGGLVIE